MPTKRAATAAHKKSAGKKKATAKKPAKKKAGAPVTVGADKPIGVRVPSELFARVKKRMGENGCSLSEAVRQGLELWLRA